ncbi:flavin reductase family protein [Alteromonas sp. CYL-A6]|uniref:flavin reductase family protein n=1 Tax=Alteromonas nitratireducens TaxID=3390813 RepID=UPI0034C31064
MTMNRHFYTPAQGHNLAHDPFNAIIAPRPIGWISSVDAQGKVNLAPYSFFNAFNYVPPIIGFASVGYKDTLRNIEQTGEFCWNMVNAPLAQAMNETCRPVEPGVDEFDLAGLEKSPSQHISVPFVSASPVVMECRKTQIVQLQGASGETVDTWMVFGEVVGVHIDTALLKDGVFQTAAAQPLLRAGGPGDYFTISEDNKLFMPRPR